MKVSSYCVSFSISLNNKNVSRDRSLLLINKPETQAKDKLKSFAYTFGVTIPARLVKHDLSPQDSSVASEFMLQPRLKFAAENFLGRSRAERSP